MPSQNLIKNITSKDLELSKKTILEIIKSKKIDDFQELCNKSDFIFPFLKERIINDFTKLIQKEDLNTINEFSKIYCADFEDLIVNSWVKYASEDLTDEILELFENGTNEQKTYCAKYFSKINDPLALEYLNKYAFCDFEPLKINCAQALSTFGDCEILNKMKEIVLNSTDDFEKLNAFNFISTYNGEEQIKFVVENCFNSPFLTNILSNILDFNDINYLKNILDNETLLKIFQVIIEEYPEDLSLDTCYYWNLVEFIKIIYNFKTIYSNNLLLIAREKFSEFSENDIYSFDFDKNVKSEIKNISNLLNSFKLTTENLENYQNDNELSALLSVIKELKLNNYSEFLAQLFNQNKINEEKKAEIAQILKELNKINLLDNKNIENIENKNVKALIESYL